MATKHHRSTRIPAARILAELYPIRPRSDSLLWWAEQYLLLGLLRSRDSIERARIIRRFIRYMLFNIDSDSRQDWTARVTRSYEGALKGIPDSRSIRHALGVLAEFAKWIQLAAPTEAWMPVEDTAFRSPLKDAEPVICSDV